VGRDIQQYALAVRNLGVYVLCASQKNQEKKRNQRKDSPRIDSVILNPVNGQVRTELSPEGELGGFKISL